MYIRKVYLTYVHYFYNYNTVFIDSTINGNYIIFIVTCFPFLNIALLILLLMFYYDVLYMFNEHIL